MKYLNCVLIIFERSVFLRQYYSTTFLLTCQQKDYDIKRQIATETSIPVISAINATART